MLQSLDALILDTAAFGGMHLDNVTRGHGWRFLEIGRRLERAATNLEILRFGAGASPARLVPLLEICDSTMTYRRLHFAAPTLPLTLDLLLQDESNPRSVFFQLDALLQQTSALPAESAEGPPSSELKKAAAIREAVQQFPISTLSAEARLEPALTQLCVAQVAELETFSDLLTERYFSHANRHKYRPNSPSSP